MTPLWLIRVRTLGFALAALLAVAGVGWLWTARSHARYIEVTAAPGAAAEAAGTTFRLEGLRLADEIAPVYEWDDPLTPVAGAVFVVARVAYSGPATLGYCDFYLAGDGREWAEFAYYRGSAEAGVVQSCLEGPAGTLETVFEVPRAVVGEIAGVRVTTMPSTLDGGSDYAREWDVHLAGTVG